VFCFRIATSFLSWNHCVSLIRLICLHQFQNRALERHRPCQRKKKGSVKDHGHQHLASVLFYNRQPFFGRIDLLVLESMCLWFQTSPYPHCAALSLSSRRSLFMSYVLRRSVSSWKVVARWTHHCLTAPSRCSGHPTGIRESSNCPSPFCSMTVPNNGTSMVAFRLFFFVRARCLSAGLRS